MQLGVPPSSSIVHEVKEVDMQEPRDALIPGPSTAWQLWHLDTFDRDASPSLERSGVGIISGLCELWRLTLLEAVNQDGSTTFSRFHLTWGETPVTRVDIYVDPLRNPALGLLRRRLEVAGPNLLGALAKDHLQRLADSDRWQATAIDWSQESREVLAKFEPNAA